MILDQDLDQDSGLEDWLIGEQEATNRRLIKQTSRHNIYRADWFGDVLIYEPRSPSKPAARKSPQEITETKLSQRLNAQELHLRLETLSLTESPQQQLSPGSLSASTRTKSRSQQSLVSDMNESSTDSAYSSSSTSPLYQMSPLVSSIQKTSQFEFPHKESSNQVFFCDEPEASSKGAAPRWPRSKTSTPVPPMRDPVALNKDSYLIGCLNGARSASKQDDFRTGFSRLDQVRELRLIAHEGFMLFMGASIDHYGTGNEEKQTFRSLVIQMNHPKAVSLSDLLHFGTKGTGSSLASPHSGSTHSGFHR